MTHIQGQRQTRVPGSGGGQGQKNGCRAPKIGVVCSPRHFDLVLIGTRDFGAQFRRKIDFRRRQRGKMDVDVALSDIVCRTTQFRRRRCDILIPLDGFPIRLYLEYHGAGYRCWFQSRCRGSPAVSSI